MSSWGGIHDLGFWKSHSPVEVPEPTQGWRDWLEQVEHRDSALRRTLEDCNSTDGGQAKLERKQGGALEGGWRLVVGGWWLPARLCGLGFGLWIGMRGASGR